MNVRPVFLAPYRPPTLNHLHHGRSQPAQKSREWMTTGIPIPCEKHPGRPGKLLMLSSDASQSYVYRKTTGKSWHGYRAMLVHQMCSGGLWAGRGRIRLTRYPVLPLNLHRKGENNFSSCLGRHLPSSSLATTHELGLLRATQIVPGSSSCGEGAGNREAGANWAWWALLPACRQSTRTSKADFPDEQ